MAVSKSTTADIRINARLTGNDARHFLELQRGGAVAASDLLRDALREYYVTHTKPRAGAFALMSESGFIGGGYGDADLSSNYKAYLTESLDDKYPHRVSEPQAGYGRPRKRK